MRDLRMGHVEGPESGQVGKLTQAGVCDLGARQVKLLDLRQVRNVDQARIGDLGSVESQTPKLGQFSKVCQSGIRNTRVRQIEGMKFGKTFQPRKPVVVDRAVWEKKNYFDCFKYVVY
jgi:hypothetical protein